MSDIKYVNPKGKNSINLIWLNYFMNFANDIEIIIDLT